MITFARRGADGMPPLTVAGVAFRNPILSASGTAGHGAEMGGLVRLDQLGAVVSKSLYHGPWPGNRAPRLAETPSGMLNAVGLQGPGVAAWLEEDLPALRESGATVVASIWGRSTEDYRRAASALRGVDGLAALEINLSCPNLEGRSSIFAHDPDATAEVVAACAESDLPLWAKLSANTDRVVEVAASARSAGAAAVTLINTLLGMVLDHDGSRPLLGNGGGGLSGPAIRPVALRAVWDVREAIPDLPIIGVGGVRNARDAYDLMAAGASLVQIGTASFRSPRVLTRTARDLARLVRRRGFDDWSKVTGSAHGVPRS